MAPQAQHMGKWDWSIDGFVWGPGIFGADWRVPVGGGFLYLITIFIIQMIMRDRKPLQLRKAYAAHNWVLSVFSLICFIGTVYEVTLHSQKMGAVSILCEKDVLPAKGRLYYWSYIFYLSKFYEFVDTVFLALKKKPLDFLHCYHHAIVPTGCWLGLIGWKLPLTTGVICNSFVHTLMYYYYGASQLGIRVSWKRYITVVQILQFCSGGVLTLLFSIFFLRDVRITETPSSFSVSFTKGCFGEVSPVLVVAAINLSFLVLFIMFYSKTYRRPAAKTAKSD